MSVGALVWTMLAGALWVGPATPVASASATEVLADWQMNEAAGATVMVDGSGNGLDGVIGSAVVTGVVGTDSLGYKWTYTSPNQPPPKPERLVQAGDDRLNPGSGDYAVTIRFWTTQSFGNIIQKGQSGIKGGYFKWQIPSGKLSCLFRGLAADGSVQSKSVNSGSTLLNDGAWHTVRCERTVDRVTMTIDGTITRKGIGPTGDITNTKPLTIGGKLSCDQISVTCDYFVGEIDYIRIEVGPSV